MGKLNLNAILIDDIDEWIKRDTDSPLTEVTIYGAPLIPSSLRGTHDSAVCTFLFVFAQFVQLFDPPDFPGGAKCDWRDLLDIKDDIVAIWNFDYYQLSLRVAESEADVTVVLSQHRH